MKKLISVLLAALLLLSSVSAAYADGEEWKDLIDEERYEEALPLVQADAEAGNPKAINALEGSISMAGRLNRITPRPWSFSLKLRRWTMRRRCR